MKKSKPVLSLALLAAALPASAMYLNRRGTGEVLLFPYYTVNAGQTTLISLTNTTGTPKYLTANLREGYNSRKVLDFSIVLAPHDTWTATLYAADEEGRAILLTRDASCTVPDKSAWNAAPGGGWQMALFDNVYTGPREDGGPTSPARTREGHLTIVERAELAGDLAAAAGLGGAGDCSRLQHLSQSSAGLRAPGGGVYGNFSIVYAAQGTLMGGSATAIDDFADAPLFAFTTAERELLALGAADASGTGVDAQVFANGRLTEVSYPRSVTTVDPIDAVSALLMSESLYGDFERDDNYGIRSEWVITAPTKFMYTDPVMLGVPAGETQARAPFREVFDSLHEGGSCMPFTITGTLRDGQPFRFDPPSALSPPPPPPRYPSHNLCHAVGVVHFGSAMDEIYQPPALGKGLATPVLGSRLGIGVTLIPSEPRAGSAQLELGVRRDYISWDGGGEISGPSFLPPGLRGPGLRGLPVIGFHAVRYINRNALPNIAASYTRALPLDSSTACTGANGAAVTCP